VGPAHRYLVAHMTHVLQPSVLVVAVMLGAAGSGSWTTGSRCGTSAASSQQEGQFGAQVLVALGFALACEHWAGVNTHLSFTRFDSIGSIWGAWAGSCGRCSWWWDGQRRQPHDGLTACVGAATFCFPSWPSSATAVPSPLDLPREVGARPGLTSIPWPGVSRVPVVERAPARIFMGDTGRCHRRGLRAVAADEPAAAPAVIGGCSSSSPCRADTVVSYRVFADGVLMAPLHTISKLLAGGDDGDRALLDLGGLFAALGLGCSSRLPVVTTW